MQVFKTTGRKPEQLKSVMEPPAELMYLFSRFYEVHDGEPLTFQKVLAFDQVMSYGMETWEFKVLFRIDQVFWQVREKPNG